MNILQSVDAEESDTRKSDVRVLGLLLGDMDDPRSGASSKYGYLFSALAARCDLVGVRNVELQKSDRYQAALRSMRWPPDRWREAFYKSVWAFEQRSRRIEKFLPSCREKVDVLFQHGALFAGRNHSIDLPMVMYTDFTYRLAQAEDPWRVPFATLAEGQRWDALERRAYERASFVLTRSEYTRRSVIRDYGIASERVATVGGGINFAEMPPLEPLATVPRVLFIGREFERKGGDCLVTAFRRVQQRVPEAELWLVTPRNDISGPGIRCLTSIYDRKSMGELYRSCSVFAMPSRCETWGDVFLEAMAYGLPCIGSTADAMPEIIRHGETGYVIDAGDVDALEHYLEHLLTDASLRQSMGTRGYTRALQNYTWDLVAQRIVPYLHQAADLTVSAR